MSVYIYIYITKYIYFIYIKKYIGIIYIYCIYDHIKIKMKFSGRKGPVCRI